MPRFSAPAKKGRLNKTAKLFLKIGPLRNFVVWLFPHERAPLSPLGVARPSYDAKQLSPCFVSFFFSE
jgi:hypothetical protein